MYIFPPSLPYLLSFPLLLLSFLLSFPFSRLPFSLFPSSQFCIISVYFHYIFFSVSMIPNNSTDVLVTRSTSSESSSLYRNLGFSFSFFNLLFLLFPFLSDSHFYLFSFLFLSPFFLSYFIFSSFFHVLCFIQGHHSLTFVAYLLLARSSVASLASVIHQLLMPFKTGASIFIHCPSSCSLNPFPAISVLLEPVTFIAYLLLSRSSAASLPSIIHPLIMSFKTGASVCIPCPNPRFLNPFLVMSILLELLTFIAYLLPSVSSVASVTFVVYPLLMPFKTEASVFISSTRPRSLNHFPAISILPEFSSHLISISPSKLNPLQSDLPQVPSHPQFHLHRPLDKFRFPSLPFKSPLTLNPVLLYIELPSSPPRASINQLPFLLNLNLSLSFRSLFLLQYPIAIPLHLLPLFPLFLHPFSSLYPPPLCLQMSGCLSF